MSKGKYRILKLIMRMESNISVEKLPTKKPSHRTQKMIKKYKISLFYWLALINI